MKKLKFLSRRQRPAACQRVEALLAAHLGAPWAQRFACVVCAEDAPPKKPDPQVYELVQHRLGLSRAAVLAIEDSPAGVAACVAADGADAQRLLRAG